MGHIVFDLLDDIYSVVLMTYHIEALFLFSSCTLIFFLFRSLVERSHHKTYTKVYESSTYQTFTELFNFKINTGYLSSNNAVYLTIFNRDGLVALIYHIFYGLFMYFRRDPTNIYYLCMSALLIYEYRDLKSMTHFLTLTIFSGLATIVHVYGMSQLIKNQYMINHKSVVKCVLKKGKTADGKEVLVQLDKSILQKNLKRGDLIHLDEKTEIPADILLLNCQVLTQELSLTGENVVLSKSGLNVPIEPNQNAKIYINHYQNEGLVMIGDHNYTYTSKNMIFRGTKIVDKSAFGIIIETGNDCQIYRIDMNHHKQPTSVQKLITNFCLINLYLMLLLASLMGILIYSKTSLDSYGDLWVMIRRMVLLFNTMVPLSLQFFFTTGSQILSKRIAKHNNVIINPNGLMSFQVNPDYIVSDKTGTITTNQFELKSIYTKNKNERDITDLCNANLKTINEIYVENIFSCTEIQPHSKTGQLLKSDIVEEQLASFVLNRSGRFLTKNAINHDGSGDILIGPKHESQWEHTDEMHISRVYYQPYKYDLEVKLSVVRDSNQKLILHIQGTPEAINDYSGDLGPILKTIENGESPNNAYRRVIAHARGEITEENLKMLRMHPHKVLKNVVYVQVSAYVFYDYIVEHVDLAIHKLIQEQGKHLTILTGDKMSSAVEIGRAIKMINQGSCVIHIENIDDINLFSERQSGTDIVAVLNGRLLESLVSSNKTAQLSAIVLSGKKMIIYRASPCGKQQYVSFLQSWFRKEVMMVGDGSNDLAALVESNLSLAVSHGDENQNVCGSSQIVIKDWCQIPHLLVDFQEKRIIITNVAEFVLMKHMITAFILLYILLGSRFSQIRDPANPIIMNLMNFTTFVSMCAYCYKTNVRDLKNHSRVFLGIPLMVIQGVILGLFNSWVVFSFINFSQVESGINICILIQTIELIGQLIYLHTFF